MKTFFYTYFLCFTVFYCYGQNKKELSGDTTFWYRTQYRNGDKIQLPHLILSPDKIHFRFWQDEQIVDIWTLNGVIFNGMVTSYIQSYEADKPGNVSKKPSKTFFKQVYLDSSIARKAFKLTESINKIPTESAIKGWKQGLDGLEYVLETSTPSTYNFRTYWTPTAQPPTLLEAKQIHAFVVNLDMLLGLSQKFRDFFLTLRPGSYIGDGPKVTIKLTPKQTEYYKRTKPIRDYYYSVSDTLNHYLSDTLTKIFVRFGDLKCFDEFFLKLSKDNKLLSVTTNNKFVDRDDKLQFLSCRKKIFEAFKLIRINFVHSKVAYLKEFEFWQGKATVFNADF